MANEATRIHTIDGNGRKLNLNTRLTRYEPKVVFKLSIKPDI